MKKLLREYSDDKYINLTTTWMSQKYDEMNNELFDGRLGSCHFEIFTTGKGANGRVLGWFSMQRNGLKYNKQQRRLYLNDFWGDKIYINIMNFDVECNPTIKLNGNYKWSEKAALSTLVHEMCHYYTFMNGYVPTQAHGREFKNIAAYVSSKSDGIFTVQRLAQAEQMQDMVLDSSIQAKNDKRTENKMNKMIPMVLYWFNDEIRLINANSQKVVDEVVNYEKDKPRCLKIDIYNDAAFKELLFKSGYRKTMTTYRYWTITNSNIAKELDNYPKETIFKNKGYNEN